MLECVLGALEIAVWKRAGKAQVLLYGLRCLYHCMGGPGYARRSQSGEEKRAWTGFFMYSLVPRSIWS